VQVVDDGTQLVVGAPQQSSAQQPGARRTLVLGGARSGKSALAERLLQAQPHVVYVAPGPVPSAADPDWLARVQLHQGRRPTGWNTCETTDVATVVRQARQPVLVDCLGTWLTAVLDGSGAWQERPGWRHQVDDAVDDLLDAWHATSGDDGGRQQRSRLGCGAGDGVGAAVSRRARPAERPDGVGVRARSARGRRP
jgi:adenosyl cobinamide kinase/adenosyl cobinamide phosphate guanylyltransferase